jgi:hypothetical protein
LCECSNLGEKCDTMDPSGLREVSDRTQTAPFNVLSVDLSVPECLSGQGYEGITLGFEDVR